MHGGGQHRQEAEFDVCDCLVFAALNKRRTTRPRHRHYGSHFAKNIRVRHVLHVQLCQVSSELDLAVLHRPFEMFMNEQKKNDSCFVVEF